MLLVCRSLPQPKPDVVVCALDHVFDIGTGDKFNLFNLYRETEDDTTYNDNPFQHGDYDCNYCEPHQVNDMVKGFKTECNSVRSYFHLNCRGLAANWDSFKHLVCEMNHMFDFIGISECFRTHDDPRLHLSGYHDLIARCRHDSPRGGVGIFVKNTTNYTIREDLSLFLPHIFESIFIEIINESSKNSVVGVIYRPNTAPWADLDIFETNLQELMNSINNEAKLCTIMGDFNVDLIKFNIHQRTNDYLENIFSCGFLPVILKPTRITHSSATLIDHIYTNDIANPGISSIILTDVADHLGTAYFTKLKLNRRSVKPIKRRLFSERNIATFKHKLLNGNFDNIKNLNCPDEAYSKFMELYLDYFNESFPLCEFKPNSNNLKREPWFNDDLLVSAKLKNKLYSKKLKKPTEPNIERYKDHLREYNKQKRITKNSYYRTMLDKNKHNIKQSWIILKQAMGKNNDKSSYPNQFLIENKNISDKQDIANSFNTFFSKIGAETSNNVPQTNKQFASYLPNSIMNSIFIEPVSPSDVLKATNRLKPKTSSGHDELSTKLMKETISLILEPITHIINVSFDTGIFPKLMKIAKVIPIYKKSDKALMQSYRPISLLPVFSKIIERIMYNKIVSFFNCNNLFYKHQYGFRCKHSTIHPIIHLLNHCSSAYNERSSETTLAIFCDLSKAFDVINHDILLRKLNNYGIRGIANTWLRSYLSGRQQYVEFESHKSSYTDIECGVPQGSILGPLLYLIYVNDISNSCDANILSFADDTTIFLSHSNLDQLFIKANFEINKLYEWFCSTGSHSILQKQTI